MASIFCDNRSGYFYAQFFDRQKRPARKTIPLGTRRKRVAEKALSKMEDAVSLGALDPWISNEEPEDKLVTLGVAVEAYLKSCSHLKANTVKTCGDILNPFQAHLGPDYMLSNISVNDILAWLESTSAGDVTRRI